MESGAAPRSTHGSEPPFTVAAFGDASEFGFRVLRCGVGLGARSWSGAPKYWTPTCSMMRTSGGSREERHRGVQLHRVDVAKDVFRERSPHEAGAPEQPRTEDRMLQMRACFDQ
jgi:hypothetical protein